MNQETYSISGNEIGIQVVDPMPIGEGAFVVKIPSLPPQAKPIIDEKTGSCVGYSYEGAKNVWHIYDVFGQKIGIEEAPLEAPLFDPYDLIFIGPAFFKAAKAGFEISKTLLTRKAIASATTKIYSRIIPTLRSRIYGLSVKKITFSEKAATRLYIQGRYVPIHILHLAIKYGKRMPDPQGVAGLFRYEIRFTRYFKRSNKFVKEEKTLEVLVREKDWVIMHFMYY